jgi:hypothetical protein
MNNELEKILKEAVVAYLRFCHIAALGWRV